MKVNSTKKNDKQVELAIVFNWKNSLYDILDQLSKINFDNETYIFNLEFRKTDFINPDGLLLFTSFANELRSLGKEVIIKFTSEKTFDTINYASRINFFRNLGINFEEKFTRHPSDGKFIEITHIPNGSYGLPQKLTDFIYKNFDLSESKAECLIQLFYEFIANITMHSNAANGGYFFFQKYPGKDQLSLIIVDSGIGIANSLQKAFPNLNNRECLENCFKLGVTSGNGRGQGLYVASELSLQNNGAFKILSGGNILIKNKLGCNILNYPNWRGSFFSWTFNTKHSMDLDLVFDSVRAQLG